MRKTQPKKIPLAPDPKFNDKLVTRFVNNLMWEGKKNTAYNIFYDALDKVQKQLRTVSTTIEEAGTRTRQMERKLRAVEQMEPTESATILALPSVGGQSDEAEESESLQEMSGAA